ncbi:hypothetical protein HH1059_05200 [Halorhodospira halochloris]|uniref:DUF2232 domain-containing protein n=1 Tax=Halorhodospira halochloris TaxID=1052 RepID=A0A0X8XBV5_HALHR|nr:hypothetical protein [Halorhodospira halochloris]MBK1651532.1 hypothetical protein [Halorhodospira halochloris]BAU57204.1 hypothetical protein HH1059_05200 [Halorhodospira halochloris]
MKAFAAFILRGPFQAATVMIAASLLPFLAVIAMGVLSLVTLRQGLQQGLFAAALAGGMLAALLWAMAGTYEPALRIVIEQWLPVLVLAEVLRRTVSLPLTLFVWAGLGALTVAGFHVVVDDPMAHWLAVTEQFLAATGAEQLPEETEAFLREDLLPIMTGLWVVNLMSVVLIGLLLGRWVQAIMFNPGGLREEFYRLDLGRSAAFVALVVLLAAVFSGPGPIYDLALVLAAAFIVQALAATHALMGKRNWSAAWLVPVYLVIPFLYMPMALLGIGEALFQWRRRLLGDGSGGAA